jgi:hypothetical protein
MKGELDMAIGGEEIGWKYNFGCWFVWADFLNWLEMPPLDHWISETCATEVIKFEKFHDSQPIALVPNKCIPAICISSEECGSGFINFETP